MANVNPLPCNTGFKYKHNGQLYVRYSTKKDVKYLKCVEQKLFLYTTKFGRQMQNDMPMTIQRAKSKPEI